MKTASRTLKLFSTTMVLALLGACGISEVYKDEAFKQQSLYQRTFPQSALQACEAAQLALLSQGYRIEKADATYVRARKEFQPDDEVNVTIDFDVTCKSLSNGSAVFANAVETTYKLKKTAGATSLSLPGAGSIAMPWSKTVDSLVKVASKTVTDKKFYKGFFDLLKSYLPT